MKRYRLTAWRRRPSTDLLIAIDDGEPYLCRDAIDLGFALWATINLGLDLKREVNGR